ncbi:MAG TPA: prolyl oligopeptidase family serine peptidase [Humisphaera sp.]|jgi:hypothetical protein|nr:prolyl oligopeptidase family serine peptidase [Humisphaera sp.]
MRLSSALRALLSGAICIFAAVGFSAAQQMKRIPPDGVAVSASDKTELETAIADLHTRIEALRTKYKSNAAMLDLLPDIEIYYNAGRYALTYNEFFVARDIASGKKLLAEGIERAKSLDEGQAPWTKAAGLVVRGYVSKIDGSVQPYGMVVPTSFATEPSRKRRLDLWYHGRGETLSEISFISDRERNAGEFTPPDTFVLHPYGRYCNANRFAGEVDTLEALENAKRHYAIDDNRILVRGFSMGGASCWLFATHHSSLFAAAAPGAGFSETADFLRIRDLSTVPWYEKTLWHEFDSIDYAVNIFNVPLVAYSGEIDGQKQAADMMDKALAAEGIKMVHIIGPNTPHRYEPGAKIEINRRLDAIASVGRNPMPREVKFTTWTLKYNQMFWVTVDAMGKHWQRARVDAQIVDANTVAVTTDNVTALTFDIAPGLCPLDVTRKPKVTIDGQEIAAAPVMSDRSWTAHFRKDGANWTAAASIDQSTLQKRHDLQGPIDDAFMDSFVMVKPTGKPMNEQIGGWTTTEMAHAIEHWRRQFRGEARVKDDSAISDADIASSNLVLWGDPSSNAILAKIADKLPVKWDASGIKLADKTYSGDKHVPVMIYPNPLNPKRYVVLNSGFTFRELDYLNNARQTPKLPDWAIIDTSTPPNTRTAGGIADAGFFGEKWEIVGDGSEGVRLR